MPDQEQPVLGPAEVGAFVTRLAADVSGGKLELPAFPDIVVQLSRALKDEGISQDRLAKIVSADAGLTARVLNMANSAALSRGGAAVTDLKRALVRIGMENVRAAAIAFAMTQLQLAASVRHIRDELKTLWNDSSLTAALAHVIASRTRAVNPDDALVTGLLHNIGKVYVLSRMEPQSPLMSDLAARDRVLNDWNSNVSRAIAENWEMPEPICEAIGQQDEVDRDHLSRADLGDVLIVAVAAAREYGAEGGTPHEAESLRPFEKLGIAPEAWDEIVSESRNEIEELRSALGS